MRDIFPLLVSVGILCSCTPSQPPSASITTAAHIKQPAPDLTEMTYLARAMLPSDQRSAAAIYSAAPSPSGQVVGTATGQAVGASSSALSGGNPMAPGSGTHAAMAVQAVDFSVAVLDSLLTPGAARYIGGVVLPKQIDGADLVEREAARQYVRNGARNSIAAFAQRTGRSVKCIEQCDGNYPTYELDRIGAESIPFYDPPTLFVSLSIPPLMDTSKIDNRVLNKAVGFEPQWAGNIAICLNDQMPTIKREIFKDEPASIVTCDARFVHPLQRALLRSVTAAIHGYVGSLPGAVFVWNGRAFALGKPVASSLIAYEIAPQIDEIGDHP